MITCGDSFLKQAVNLIEDRLNTLVPLSEGKSGEVIEAARYGLLGPGKKLRPLLTLSVYALYHKDLIPILDPACSIEMIHTYSLIHDDLPSLDNDDMRRGRPTVHKAYCESTAILAGDFLLTHAFGTLTNAPFPPERVIRMIRAMSDYSGGYHGMIAGQAIDLKSESVSISLKELQNLHSLKTGALIELSVQIALLAAQVPQEDSALLQQFARLYGLAFQVVDDIVDVISPEEKHGKTISSDLINGKSTYVSLLGLDGAKLKTIDLLEKADNCLKELNKDTSILQGFLTTLRAKITAPECA